MERIALVGGGPSALMLVKKFIEAIDPAELHIFEATGRVGCGMPYSDRGATLEHVTNVSSDELPELPEQLEQWVHEQPDEYLQKFHIDKSDFHQKEVVPRLLFGDYLSAQFEKLLKQAKQLGFQLDIHLNTKVENIVVKDNKVTVWTADGCNEFDTLIISTGHHWIRDNEGKVPGYYDSPYPPSKLKQKFNHPVAVRGSSLTALDAIKTIARSNGKFVHQDGGMVFQADESSPDFYIDMHSKQGLLPCVRVHMDSPQVGKGALLDETALQNNIKANDGFLELDFLFEKAFKEPLRESDPEFYKTIADLNLEKFIEKMMEHRNEADPFQLLQKELAQSYESISEKRPVYWKEMLASLSVALNYPAKHLSAEDMLRLKSSLMPLISIVIAFMPQSSSEELMALYKADKLQLIADVDGTVEAVDGRIIYSYNGGKETKIYKTFIDCIGQKHLHTKDLPFSDLLDLNEVSPARLRFRDSKVALQLMSEGNEDIEEIEGEYFLRVPGMNVSDSFQLINSEGVASNQIYLMAVPFMAGLNPDYSGLDFCEIAAGLIAKHIKTGRLTRAEAVSNREIVDESSVAL